MRCAGLVLAAGGGTRLGRPKALVEVGGQRLVDRSVTTLVAGGAAPVAVVVGAVSVGELSAGQHDGHVGTVLVENREWQTGMAGSLRAGLEALRAYGDVDAVAVTLVDLPGVTPAAVRAVIAALTSGARIAVTTYGGVRGHPVVLRREDWDEVAGLAIGDAGARRFLARHASDVVAVECGDTRALLDIDTEENLAAARREEW